MARILAMGMSNTDLVCRTPRLPSAGETIAGSSFDTFAGGKGANQAVAAARSGATVMFAGAVGDDEYGRERRLDLETAGIDTSALQTISGVRSGIAIIIVDDSGENQIVTVAGANGAVEEDRLLQNVADLDYDLLLMTWELAPGLNTKLIEALPATLPIVLNTAPFDASVASVLEDTRVIVIANEVEASQLLGSTVRVDDAMDAARSIQRLGCRAAVITLGKHGAVCADAEGCWSVPAPVVSVVDTTGSGDAFCGAFSAWLAAGAVLEDAVLAGVHAGSLAATRPGAQPSLPLKEDINASISSVRPH
jgi:ribokinase